MRAFTEYPVRHIDGNLAFGVDGSVWSYYLIKGFRYEYLDEGGMKAPFFAHESFLTKNRRDLHYLVLPTPLTTERIIDSTIEEIKRKDFPLKERGINFFTATKEALKKYQTEKNSIEYHALLGVQIRNGYNHVKENNKGNTIVKNFVEFVRGLASPIYQAVGLQPGDYLQSEIDEFHQEAKDLERTLEDNFSCKVERLSALQMIYFSEQNFSVGREIKPRNDFESAEIVEGTIKDKKYRAKRPNKKAFFDLQEAEVQEIDRNTLLIQRLVDHEIEENYVQYLTCYKFNGMPKHPDWEWLYNLQNELDFPVTYSIRAEHVTNDKTKRMLSDTLMVIKDQQNEAQNAGESADTDVDKSEQNAVRMKSVFNDSEWPSYQCSFIFRVSAKDRETLKSRVKELEDKLGRYKMKVRSPFGDQLSFFYETLIGSKRINRDYTKTVAPNLLAGMMFGATTNIGDNRGVYFAQTIKQNKPVFLQIDLAAKNFENIKTLFDSLAIMVAGSTGKGKSVLMNLLCYLGVLCGSYAVIFDPKGDRKWYDGLPYIPPEFINIWTLGAVDEDNGVLDPFRICNKKEDARDLAMEMIAHSQEFSSGTTEYMILGDIMSQVMELDDPCLGAVKDYAEDLLENTPENHPIWTERYNLCGALRNMKQNTLGKLMFSEIGQTTKTLDMKTPMQVVMIQNLDLPENGKPGRTPQEKLSEAIMIGLTAFAKRFSIESDRSINKIVLQDEASSVERSATGSRLLDFFKRKGRYWNTTLITGSQNATDQPETNNFGMKFAFALNSEEEAVEMLKYLNLPIHQNNIDKLRSLRRGECFFQDLYGRTAHIRVNPLFNQILDAFDTSTSTEEERKYEEQKQLEHVMV